ncbi:MAG: phosphotransferase system HPr (HPr) family protein [Planctomycetota bacterium]|jgi:phosphotransferase system HPr (HPr) family protein
MTEISLDTVVHERDFAAELAGHAQRFAFLAHSLCAGSKNRPGPWRKRDHFQLHAEADELEGLLDDYGARYNRTFCYLTELTASIRGFSLAGLSISHLSKRLASYGVLEALSSGEAASANAAVERVRCFVQDAQAALLSAWIDEACTLKLEFAPMTGEGGDLSQETLRPRLPRNVDQEHIDGEEPRIAEVASKYLEAHAMLQRAGLSALPGCDRAKVLGEHCTEELARVHEATIHNLQSAYDTHIGNTLLESRDERLQSLRGYISAALHLFQATTQLTHFVDRHESGVRSDSLEERLSRLVARENVQEVILEDLLHWALRFIALGAPLAEELLPTYTNIQSLELTLADHLVLHARPASMLVSVVNHYGTPVEMELGGSTCNASSILELMILVGSNTEARSFTFHGDERPLADIGLLFEHGFGEAGMETLPAELEYLRI